MNIIFVDTWAWYALVDTQDHDHIVAKLANEELLDKDYISVTTNLVLTETLTLIRYHISHSAAIQFRQQLQGLIAAELIRYIYVEETLEKDAWQIFERYHDQDFSFTDCTSFATMHRVGLTEAFTGDHHFRVMGFVLTP